MIDQAFTLVVPANDDEVLTKNLLRSPELRNGHKHQLLVRRHFASASLAYNSAITEAQHEIVIFLHQDLYLPEGWFAGLGRCLAFLEAKKASWGVLGCFGSRKDAHGGLGCVYTRGLGRHGRPLNTPEPVETLDEIVLIIRRSSALRFDPYLPHYHLYGPDICLTARERGLVNYAFQGFCVHNTNQLLRLPKEFYTCYHYMRRKWARQLPIYTSCLKISMLGEDLLRKRLSEIGNQILGRHGHALARLDDPRDLIDDLDHTRKELATT